MEKRGKDLARLAAALLRSGAEVGDVLEIVNHSTAAEPHAVPGPKRDLGVTVRGKPRQRSVHVPHEAILRAIGDAGRSVTKQEIAERTGAPMTAVYRHLFRGVQLGNILREGPKHYRLTRSGERFASGGAAQKRPKPDAPTGKGVTLTLERVVATVNAHGKAESSRTFLRLLGNGTEQAVRSHLKRGVERGLLIEHPTSPLTWGPLGSAPPEKIEGVRMSRHGQNDGRIVAVLTQAGKPVDTAGFMAADSFFGSGRRGTLAVALSSAVKRKVIKRLAAGLYDLPNRGAPKSPRPAESPKNGRAAKNQLELGSALAPSAVSVN